MFKEYEIYKLAAQKLIEGNCLILDTETTGLRDDDEIIELGIIDCQGNVVYESLFKPEKDVHWAAGKVSGLSNKKLKNEPLFKDEFNNILIAIGNRPIIAFNEAYDERVFYQTANRYGLETSLLDNVFSKAFCAQKLYELYIGVVNPKLEVAYTTEGIDKKQDHRAVSDCLVTLELLKKVADFSNVPSKGHYNAVKAAMKDNKETPKKKSIKKEKEVSRTSEYLRLFNEGRSIDEIAKAMNVRSGTVEQNIVGLYSKGKIDSIDSLIQPEYIEQIIEVIRDEAWDGRLTPVKEKMPEECSWGCVRAVIAKEKKGEFADLKSTEHGTLRGMIEHAKEMSSEYNRSATPKIRETKNIKGI